MTIYFDGYNPAAYWLLKILPLVLMAVLTFNLIQKKFIPSWGIKRLATLYLSCGILILLAAAFMIFRYGVSDLWLIPISLGLLLIVFLKRQVLFPFYARCRQCNRLLTLFQRFCAAENLCTGCQASQTETRPGEPAE